MTTQVRHYVTQGISQRMEAGGPKYNQFIAGCVVKFLDGDWGNVYPEDANQNTVNQEHGHGFILGAYDDAFHQDKIWIGQSIPSEEFPVVMLPEEY